MRNFIICSLFLTKYYEDDQVKGDKRFRKCSTHWGKGIGYLKELA
jgi:hypothetical protein